MGGYFQPIASFQNKGKVEAFSEDGKIVLVSQYDYSNLDSDGAYFLSIMYSEYAKDNQFLEKKHDLGISITNSKAVLYLQDQLLTFYALSKNQTTVVKVTSDLNQETSYQRQYLSFNNTINKLYLNQDTKSLITTFDQGITLDNQVLSLVDGTYTIKNIGLHADQDGVFVFFPAYYQDSSNSTYSQLICRRYDSSLNQINTKTITPKHQGNHDMDSFSYNQANQVFSVGFNYQQADFSFLIQKSFNHKSYHNYHIVELSKNGNLVRTHGNQDDPKTYKHKIFTFDQTIMDTEKSKKMPSAENYGFINSDNSSYPCSFNTYRTGFNFLLGEEFNQINEDLEGQFNFMHSANADHMYTYDNYNVNRYRFIETGNLLVGLLIGLAILLIIGLVLFKLFCYQSCKEKCQQMSQRRNQQQERQHQQSEEAELEQIRRKHRERRQREMQ